HCDSLGIYSHFQQASVGMSNAATDRTTYLRGYQLSDSNGLVQFETIYPGWYNGRVTHIHIKVHIGGYSHGHTAHTGQLYFNDTITDRIAVLSPYNKNKGKRIKLTEDYFYDPVKGHYSLLSLQYTKPDVELCGLTASITVGVKVKTVSITMYLINQ
ncbi:unnamed protein product, partial [Didymodactylos carnosus]